MLRRGALEGPHTPFPSRPLLRTPYPMRPQTVHTKTSRPPRRLTAGLQPVESRKKERHTRDLCSAGAPLQGTLILIDQIRKPRLRKVERRKENRLLLVECFSASEIKVPVGPRIEQAGYKVITGDGVGGGSCNDTLCSWRFCQAWHCRTFSKLTVPSPSPKQIFGSRSGKLS